MIPARPILGDHAHEAVDRVVRSVMLAQGPQAMLTLVSTGRSVEL
jgi:hypothetical protein